MDRRKIDVALSSVLIIASIVILTSDSLVEGGVETELGSMLLPRIVATLITVFAAMIGIPSLLRLMSGAPQGETERIDTKGFLGIAAYVAILVSYWYAMPHLGFILTTSLAMFSIAILLEGRQWLAMAAVSIVTPLVVFYTSSHLLRVFLPTWSLT